MIWPLSVMQLIGFFFTCVSINSTGGIYSVDFFWVVLLITNATLLTSVNFGIVLSVFGVIATVFFFYLNQKGFSNYAQAAIDTNGYHALFTIPFLILMLTSMLAVYKRILTNVQQKLEEAQTTKIKELDSKVNELLAEMESLRSSLAQDFHDEFGNKLAGLSMLAYQLNATLPIENDKEMLQQISQKIEDTSREIYASGKDFVWSMKNIQLSPNELFRYISDFGKDAFSLSEVRFLSSNKLKEEKSTIEHTFDLVLLLKEAISNAMKHSEASEIVFEISEVGNRLVFLVKDNGKGFSQNHTSNGFGLRGMKERAEKMNAQLQITANDGTIIKLSL